VKVKSLRRVGLLATPQGWAPFKGGRIIELSAIGFAGFVLIGIGRKMKRKDTLNEKLDFDVKKNTDKNPDSETFAKNTDEEDSKP